MEGRLRKRGLWTQVIVRCKGRDEQEDCQRGNYLEQHRGGLAHSSPHAGNADVILLRQGIKGLLFFPDANKNPVL